jgi:Phage-related protein, tail component
MGLLRSIAGSKGGASAHTPVEAPDTLRSISSFHIVDLISEGEIAGLVNGLQSVYLDGTPVANPDGTLNFQGVAVQTRPGTQDQSYIPGYGGVENDIGVSTELKSGTPWIHQVTDVDLSAVRITLQVDSLQKSDTSNGDINGYTVQYAIDVSTDNGAYQTVLTTAFSGKTTSAYQRSHRIDLPAATTGWNVRVRRLTPNANSATVSDTTRVVSITEIIDAKLRYPNSALVAISGDASQFSNIPSRAYEIFGRKIRIPSNYDPSTRAYNGVWDGSFQTEWSNNPAWVLYDLITQDRFGLGDLIDDSMVDKWELYRIAQYCDDLVDDGKGGQEPRFTCNTYLQERADAFRLLSDMASIFRGVSYWMGGSIVSVADMPQDPVYTYTKANTIGKFTYQSSPRKTRYTTALVSWNDPSNAYGRSVEYVPDNDGIARYGLMQMEMTAFGCTSQGQAHRAGRWALVTSQLETDSVTFAVGLDHVHGAIPGRIIRVQDPARAGARNGGRLSTATDTTIVVDRAPDHAKSGDTLVVHTPDGVAISRTIDEIDGNTISVTQAFDAIPVPKSVWAVESDDLAMQHFRVLNVSDDSTEDEIRFTVSAVQHVPGKFANIDSGAQIQIPPISTLPTGLQPPPTNVRLAGRVVIEQGIANNVMTIEWDAPAGAATYKVEWQKDNGQWIQAGTIPESSIDVQGIYTGTYTARITAISNGRVPSVPAYSVPTPVEGKTGKPPVLASLDCDNLIFGIRVRWTFPEGVSDTQRTEIWASTTPQRPDDPDADPKPYLLGEFSYPTNSTELHGLSAGASLFFWGRLVDKAGNESDYYPETGATNGQSSSDAGPILQYLTGQITKSQLGQELLAPIEAAEGLASFIEPPVAWAVDIAYAKGGMVSHGGRLWLALEDVAAGGPEPGTDADAWYDVGAVEQTAAGLALQMAQTTLKVEDLDGVVQATVSRTDAVYAQLNPKSVGDINDGTIGGDNTLPPTAGFYSQVLAQVDNDHALGKRIETVQATIGAVAASVTVETQARVDADGAMASQITTVQATAGAAQASAQLAFQTAANIDGKVSAALIGKVGITSDGKYYQAGFAVGIDNSGGTVQSQFLVTADTFAILPSTAGGGAVAPFVIQGGQAFINQALIGTGWITDAMIGNQIKSTALNSSGQAVWEINKSGTRYVRGEGFTITEDVNGWRMTNNANGVVVVEIGMLS